MKGSGCGGLAYCMAMYDMDGRVGMSVEVKYFAPRFGAAQISESMRKHFSQGLAKWSSTRVTRPSGALSFGSTRVRDE